MEIIQTYHKYKGHSYIHLYNFIEWIYLALLKMVEWRHVLIITKFLIGYRWYWPIRISLISVKIWHAQACLMPRQRDGLMPDTESAIMHNSLCTMFLVLLVYSFVSSFQYSNRRVWYGYVLPLVVRICLRNIFCELCIFSVMRGGVGEFLPFS
jgi:hypothetical protein